MRTSYVVAACLLASCLIYGNVAKESTVSNPDKRDSELDRNQVQKGDDVKSFGEATSDEPSKRNAVYCPPITLLQGAVRAEDVGAVPNEPDQANLAEKADAPVDVPPDEPGTTKNPMVRKSSKGSKVSASKSSKPNSKESQIKSRPTYQPYGPISSPTASYTSIPLPSMMQSNLPVKQRPPTSQSRPPKPQPIQHMVQYRPPMSKPSSPIIQYIPPMTQPSPSSVQYRPPMSQPSPSSVQYRPPLPPPSPSFVQYRPPMPGPSPPIVQSRPPSTPPGMGGLGQTIGYLPIRPPSYSCPPPPYYPNPYPYPPPPPPSRPPPPPPPRPPPRPPVYQVTYPTCPPGCVPIRPPPPPPPPPMCPIGCVPIRYPTGGKRTLKDKLFGEPKEADPPASEQPPGLEFKEDEIIPYYEAETEAPSDRVALDMTVLEEKPFYYTEPVDVPLDGETVLNFVPAEDRFLYGDLPLFNDYDQITQDQRAAGDLFPVVYEDVIVDDPIVGE